MAKVELSVCREHCIESFAAPHRRRTDSYGRRTVSRYLHDTRCHATLKFCQIGHGGSNVRDRNHPLRAMHRWRHLGPLVEGAADNAIVFQAA